MAHVEKYIRADVSGLFIHYDRSPGHLLSNKDIDTSHTYLNYNLADQDQPLPQYAFLTSRLKQIKTNGRKNQNVICDWIITQPQDVRESDSRKFFTAAYTYLSGKYGKQNVVSSYVHMDEIGNTPHMHFCFVPVEVLEDGMEKLNAKAVINRKELQTFHKVLQKAMDDAMGYHISITSGITAAQGGNKTIDQLKKETALKNQLPQGKKKILSADTAYTEAENKELHELAEDGIAYRIEKEAITAEKHRLSGNAMAINEKARILREKEEQLKTERAANEQASRALGAPSAKDYAEMSSENIQLHQEVQVLKEDLHTVACNIGSEIMKEIPIRTEIDYKSIPEDPSPSVMKVIRSWVDNLMENLRSLKTAVLNITARVQLFSRDFEYPAAEELKDNVFQELPDCVESQEIQDVIAEIEAPAYEYYR